MTRFFERFLEKKNVENVDENENVEDVDCAYEERVAFPSFLLYFLLSLFLFSRAQSTFSTFLGVVENGAIDTKHRFPACLNCSGYSWKADGNLMRPWCKKIDAGVFELVSCPDGRWKKSKAIIIN